MVSFDGQVVVVTGAGRGIGRAHAMALAQRGATVVVNDLAAEHADDVVARIKDLGGTASASYRSISSPDGAAAVVADALDRHGTVDAVVNNAGFMRNAPFEQQTPQTLAAMLDVHLVGPFFLTQAAWPIFREKGYGRVVMTSSAGGMFAMGGQPNYAAAKAAVYGLAKALAFEGRPHGILVNTVLPHATTEVRHHDPALAGDPARAAAEQAWAAGHGAHFKPGLREAIAPLRLPEAISPFVVFLASQACTVTGEAFAAGCGRIARVFVGETRGWATDPAGLTVEDVESNLDAIRSIDDYSIPENLYEEIELMARSIGCWS